MRLNVKVFEMVAKIESQRRRVYRSFFPIIEDWLRDSYVHVKKTQEELKENKGYRY